MPKHSSLAGRNQALVGIHNRGVVLRALLAHEQVSRRDLCRLSGLTPPTVTNIVRELITLSLLREVGSKPQLGALRVGRKQVMLALNPLGAYAIAVHVGITFLMVALVDLHANVLAHVKMVRRAAVPPAEVLREAGLAARQLVQEHAPAGARYVGLGVGSVGLVDPVAGVLRASAELGWHNVPIVDFFHELDLGPAYVENNVRAMALGEAWFGHGRHVENLCLVWVGNTIGCGLIIDRQLYSGSHYAAGRLGHVVVQEDGPLCACGGRGCLQTVASEYAIGAAGQEAIAAGQSPLLARLAATGAPPGSAGIVYQAAAMGDEVAARIVEQAADRLGLAIWNAVCLLNPDRIVLATFNPRARAPLLARLQAILAARNTGEAGAPLVLVGTELGDEPALVGAGTLALVPFYHSPVLRSTLS